MSMRDFVSEFKQFAIKGNALQLAIAVVIGNAFSGVVNSLVGDIITPILGLLTGNVDFKQLSLPLSTGNPPLVVHYGSFLQSIFNFLVITLSIFIVFKLLSTARKKLFREEEQHKVPEHEKPAQERLLEEIRDLLKSQKRDTHS